MGKSGEEKMAIIEKCWPTKEKVYDEDSVTIDLNYKDIFACADQGRYLHPLISRPIVPKKLTAMKGHRPPYLSF